MTEVRVQTLEYRDGDEWSPDFTYDDEWGDTEAKARAALKETE